MIPSFRVKSGPDPVSREATKLRKGSVSSISFSRAVVRRVRAHALDPRTKLHLLVEMLPVRDVESRAGQHLLPFDEAKAAPVAWVRQFLEGLELGGEFSQILCRLPVHDRSIRRDGVDDADRAARHQHAIGFGGEARHVVEMMRGEAADDEIEARVREGKVLCLGVQRPDIGEAAALPRASASRASISSVMSVAVTLAT